MFVEVRRPAWCHCRVAYVTDWMAQRSHAVISDGDHAPFAEVRMVQHLRPRQDRSHRDTTCRQLVHNLVPPPLSEALSQRRSQLSTSTGPLSRGQPDVVSKPESPAQLVPNTVVVAHADNHPAPVACTECAYSRKVIGTGYRRLPSLIDVPVRGHPRRQQVSDRNIDVLTVAGSSRAQHSSQDGERSS